MGFIKTNKKFDRPDCQRRHNEQRNNSVPWTARHHGQNWRRDIRSLCPLDLPDQPRPDGSPVFSGTRLRRPQRERTVIDAYCGIGTISLFLAKKAKEVYGVEIVPQEIEDAKRFDVLVVDPPRKGCDEPLLRTILEYRAKRLVYVSCTRPHSPAISAFSKTNAPKRRESSRWICPRSRVMWKRLLGWNLRTRQHELIFSSLRL